MVPCGSGLRLLECLRLRVKDVDLTRNEILVREGSVPAARGDSERYTLRMQLPRRCEMSYAKRWLCKEKYQAAVFPTAAAYEAAAGLVEERYSDVELWYGAR